MSPRFNERIMGPVGFALRPRPLRLAYYEASLDLEDDFFWPVVSPDVLVVGAWGKRDRYERLRRQIDRRRTEPRVL